MGVADESERADGAGEAERVRLFNGVGPEVTVPDWAGDEAQPSPEQWLEWFLGQSEDAQLAIVTYHLDVEWRLSAVERALHP